MKKAIYLWLAVMFVSGLLLAACPAPTPSLPPAPPAPPPSQPKLPDSITWGQRSITGTSYVVSVATLRVWEETLGIKCFASEVASSLAAFPQMKEGKVDFWGPVTIRDGYLANNGMMEYEGAKCDLRVFFASQSTGQLFVALPRSGIKNMEDLNGKTTTYSSVRAVTMTEIGSALLEFYGLKVREIENLPMAEKHAALHDGSVDASLEGLPNIFQIWETDPDAYYIPISKEAGEYVASKYPWFTDEIMPPDWSIYKGNYVGPGPGLDYPVYCVGTPMVTYCPADMSEDVVYQLIKCMYDHSNELVAVHPYFSERALDKAVRPLSVPYHAGAIKYYKEVGLWTPEAEANQQKQLSNLGKSK